MKKGLIFGIFLLSFVLIGGFGIVSAVENQPTITVISPNGGESYTSSEKIIVMWNSSNSLNSESNLVRILLINHSSGEFVKTIDNIPSPDSRTNRYSLDISDINSGIYVIHIEYTDVTECPSTVTCYNDDSDSPFTITNTLSTFGSFTCRDSDGENYNVQGKVTGLESPESVETFYDYCGISGDEEGKLVEYICSDNNYVEKILYECPEDVFCVEGACVQVAGEVDDTKEIENVNTGFRYAKWECYNGEFEKQGSETSCKVYELWQSYAEEFCADKCSEETGECGVNSFSVGGDCLDDEIETGNFTSGEGFGSAEIPLICKNSCAFEDSCLPIGVRTEGKYCNINGELLPQLEGDASCNNNFECESNVCVSGQCVETSLIQRILEWFRRLFGGSENNQNNQS